VINERLVRLASDSLVSEEGSAIVNAVSVRTGCHRAIVIPTIEVGNKESVNDCVAESVIPNKYRQHGTIYLETRQGVWMGNPIY
jgi:hypothetical protein